MPIDNVERKPAEEMPEISGPFQLPHLRAHPNALAPAYSAFRVDERLLLTGHSHQAWPDRARRGQVLAFEDAAERVDDKWERAFEKAERVRRGFASLMEDTDGLYALASNTHELLLRFLSALPLRNKPRIVTTDGEFHTARRQLQRLEEEGLEVVRVASSPARTVGARLAEACDDRTAVALVSSVFFRSAEIAGGLRELANTCQTVGCELLVDAYHSLNAAPFSIPGQGLERAFVVGGGYKYLQLGEGNCFLRFPRDCDLRPVITGWFSEYSSLSDPGASDRTVYGQGADLFAGATYDPTSHYRAAEVFDFFEENGLTPELLRQVSQHQIGLLTRRFDDLDLPPNQIDRDRSLPLECLGGFLALSAPRAGEICAHLRRQGMLSDHRDGVLRLGPAPYLSDQQLEDAIGLLGKAVQTL